MSEQKTVDEIIESYNDEQKRCLYELVGRVVTKTQRMVIDYSEEVKNE